MYRVSIELYKPHRGQTSEHAREITRGSHRSIRKTLHVADDDCLFLRVEAKYKIYFFTSMKFSGDDREEEEELMTRIVLE